MPIRRSPQSTPAALAARRANSHKSTGPRTAAGKQRTLDNLKRHFARLAGVPEFLVLDQKPGVAIDLYNELIAPYEPAPALLAMHFRDLARLQLELEAWEGIRDAKMKYRFEQAFIEQHRSELEMDRELKASFSEILDTGLCRMPDSCGKFNAQCDALATIRELVKLERFADLKVPLANLYGIKLEPDTNRGFMICSCAKRLMAPEEEEEPEPPMGRDASPRGTPAAPQGQESSGPDEALEAGDEPSRQEDLKDLMVLVQAEERRVMAVWEQEIYEKRITKTASQARLAPTREDHWMNRQGERLRQAIDRKMRFTPILLKMLGLSHGRASRTPECKTSTLPKPECDFE